MRQLLQFISDYKENISERALIYAGQHGVVYGLSLNTVRILQTYKQLAQLLVVVAESAQFFGESDLNQPAINHHFSNFLAEEIPRFISNDRGLLQFTLLVKSYKNACIDAIYEKITDGKQADYCRFIELCSDKIEIESSREWEKKLLGSEESYRILAGNLPDIVYRLYIRENNRMEFFNNKIEDILGYSKSELTLGEICIIDQLIVAQDRHIVINEIKEAIRDKKSFEVFYRIISKDGEVKHFLEKGEPIYDDQGAITHIDGIIIDQTGGKKSEQALLRSRRMLRAVLDTIPVRVFWKDRNLRFLGCNIHFAQDAGLISSEEIIGKDDYGLPWKDNAARYRTDDETVMKTGVPKLNYEEFQINADREKHWLKVSKIPLRDEELNIIGVLVCYDDITAWKQIEEEKKLFFDVSLDMLCVATLDGYFKQLTPSWTETLGWTQEELMAKPYVEFVHPDDVESTNNAASNLAHGTNVLSFDNRYVCKDGSYRWLSWKSYVDLDNKLIYAIARDIQERKKMEDELKAKSDDLQKAMVAVETASKAKSRFLSSMSHEIRTPLNAIIGFTDIMFETGLNPEQEQFVTMVKQAGEELLTLINDILDLSKIESGKIELEKIPFNLAEIIKQACNLFLNKAAIKGLKLVYDIHPGVEQNVVGDPYRLRQVLNNLLSNAVKFTEKGMVHVSVSQEQKQNSPGAKIRLQFSVEDTGIGIPEDKYAMIFKSFAQVDSSVTRKYGGTGLGLGISRQLVEMMGGSINVTSEVGKGSIFNFSIALNRLTNEQLLNSEHIIQGGPKAEQDANRVKMLIADDSRQNQVVLKAFLKNMAVLLDSADNGKDALRKVMTENYDLIFMDIQMPEMDGITAIKAIRKWEQENNREPVPVIVITAHVFADDIRSCQEAGCTDYISKPIDKHSFLKTICKYIPCVDYTFEIHDKEPLILFSGHGEQNSRNLIKIDPVLKEFIPEFLLSINENISLINSCIQKKDFDKITSIGHKMKGDGGTYGLHFISEVGKSIQTSSQERNVVKLRAHLEKLRFFLDTLEVV